MELCPGEDESQLAALEHLEPQPDADVDPQCSVVLGRGFFDGAEAAQWFVIILIVRLSTSPLMFGTVRIAGSTTHSVLPLPKGASSCLRWSVEPLAGWDGTGNARFGRRAGEPFLYDLFFGMRLPPRRPRNRTGFRPRPCGL